MYSAAEEINCDVEAWSTPDIPFTSILPKRNCWKHLKISPFWLRFVALGSHYVSLYAYIKMKIEINPSSFSTLTHHQSWKSVSFHHDLPSSSSSWDGPEALVPGISWISFPMEQAFFRISVPVTLFGAYIYSRYIYIDAMMEENVKTPRSMATSCHFCFGVRNRTEVSIMEYRIHHWHHDANAMTMQSRM